MGSRQTATRVVQKEKIKAAVEARRAWLTENGVVENQPKKDTVLRGLLAELRRASKRLIAIEAKEIHVKTTAEKIAAEKLHAKEAKKEQPKEKEAKPKKVKQPKEDNAQAPVEAAEKPAKKKGKKEEAAE